MLLLALSSYISANKNKFSGGIEKERLIQFQFLAYFVIVILYSDITSKCTLQR